MCTTSRRSCCCSPYHPPQAQSRLCHLPRPCHHRLCRCRHVRGRRRPGAAWRAAAAAPSDGSQGAAPQQRRAPVCVPSRAAGVAAGATQARRHAAPWPAATTCGQARAERGPRTPRRRQGARRAARCATLGLVRPATAAKQHPTHTARSTQPSVPAEHAAPEEAQRRRKRDRARGVANARTGGKQYSNLALMMMMVMMMMMMVQHDRQRRNSPIPRHG